MQRITRYPLLLRQILQYTASDQDFPAVQAALSEAESITAAINESVREAEGDERLRVLSEDLWIGGEGWVLSPAPQLPIHYLPVADTVTDDSTSLPRLHTKAHENCSKRAWSRKPNPAGN